jgi:NAD(P)-dependent dehydrogenase (short-subunit alcohol dehydrogenase family)
MNTPGEDRIMKTYHNAPDGWLDEAVKSRPFGRLIDPQEVARACAYLASDDSGLMTGANIDFDQMVTGTSEAPLEPGA